MGPKIHLDSGIILPIAVRLFNNKGMFSPEREPHPCVAEIKYLMQPVDLSITNNGNENIIHLNVANLGTVEPVKINVTNRYVFRDLSHLTWTWQLICDRSTASLLEGTSPTENGLTCLNISKALTKILAVERLQTSKLDCKYFLNIQGRLKASESWADAGHVVINHQWPIRFSWDEGTKSFEIPKPIISSEVTLGPLRVVVDETAIQISRGPSSPFVRLSKTSGRIQSLCWKDDGTGNVLFGDEGIRPNFTRATTDNDRGGMELVLVHMKFTWARRFFEWTEGLDAFSYELRWKMKGLSQELPPTTICDSISVIREEDNVVEIEAICSVMSSGRQRLFHQTIRYEIYGNGHIRVSSHVVPTKFVQTLRSLPRVGLSFQVDPSLFKIQYFGRGPLENYPDRKSGSHFGIWNTAPSSMGYEYIVPSENGSRSDCEWIAFGTSDRDMKDRGLLVVADPGSKFSCSALLHSAAEYHHADHTCDLDERQDGNHPIHVNLDHQLMGLGGDVR